MGDVIIITLLAVVVVLIVRSMIKNRRAGRTCSGCSCHCESCSAECSQQKPKE